MAQLLNGLTVDWRECSLVEVNPLKLSGVPILIGTRLQADPVVENYVGGSPIEEISDNFEIPEALIREVLIYASKQNLSIKL